MVLRSSKGCFLERVKAVLETSNDNAPTNSSTSTLKAILELSEHIEQYGDATPLLLNKLSSKN
jgi:hypothetical protein